jgi:hypothetical protein
MPDSPVSCTFNEGGISTPGWFNVGDLFQTFEAALAGEREFRDHGYVVEFLDEIDDYSNATFLTVSRWLFARLFYLPSDHRPQSTAVYANVRRQKSVRLRRRHRLLGAFYWNFVATNLDDSPACSQACLQAAFDRVKK